MSRAYRISLSESVRRQVVVGDEVRAGLALLDVLPREEMAELLAAALRARGFADQADGTLRRVEADGVEVVVDPLAGTVVLRREVAHQVEIAAEGEVRAFEETIAQAEAEARARLRETAEAAAAEDAEAARRAVTEQLEGRLGALTDALDGIVNEVIGAALKRRAAQLGEVTEVAEDEATGSLTIRIKL